jgi:hypothetical protein
MSSGSASQPQGSFYDTYVSFPELPETAVSEFLANKAINLLTLLREILLRPLNLLKKLVRIDIPLEYTPLLS